jgi:hypothetical protein
LHDKIILEQKLARLANADGTEHTMDLRAFVSAIAVHAVQGRTPTPIADNVRWVISCGGVQVYVVELRPELRRVEWIAADSPAPFGPEAVTASRQLATPYIVLKIPFRHGQLSQRVEIFYRNQPLTELDGPGGELYFPNLLNVSPLAYNCVCWFCTQYLTLPRSRGNPTPALDAVVNHLNSGKFNLSSEYSEGESGFSYYKKLGIDPRVADVDLWEAASQQNPRWVLEVPWQTTGIVLGQLIDSELAHQRAAGPPATAAAYGNILLRKSRPR